MHQSYYLDYIRGHRVTHVINIQKFLQGSAHFVVTRVDDTDVLAACAESGAEALSICDEHVAELRRTLQ